MLKELYDFYIVDEQIYIAKHIKKDKEYKQEDCIVIPSNTIMKKQTQEVLKQLYEVYKDNKWNNK